MHPKDPRNDPRYARDLEREEHPPQQPYFPKHRRLFLTEEELDEGIEVVSIAVYGSYTLRGEHRKEVVEKSYDAQVEVPRDFNQGHVKLAVNRYVKRKLRGIRARTYHVDEEVEPKILEHKRRVRDFMSERGLRDNVRLKREYDRELASRRAEAEALADGKPPVFSDHTDYGADGLPRYSDKTYLAQ